VHEDLGVEFIDSGQQHVKNISNPIRIYRVALGKGATRSDRPFAGEPSASRGRRFGARRIAIAAAAVVAIAAIVSWQWWPPRPTTAPTSIAGPPPRSIVVLLPFAAPASEADLVTLSESLGGDVASALANSARDARRRQRRS
jgi:hypothetical protein